MSPLWPFSIGVVIAVDSEDSEFVDLTDYSSSVNSVDSVETIPSQPVWGKSGLTNSMHQVVVSAPQGSDFVVVDGFMYDINVYYFTIVLIVSCLQLHHSRSR